MRGGLRGFAVFISCIALGVAAIAGVGSFARSLGDGLAREGRIILGGDASFSLMAREASASERKFLDDNGRVSVAATMRAMARAADGQTALVEIKAVDGTYPLLRRRSRSTLRADLADALAERDGAFGAAVDPALLARLNIERGARVTIGAATIELRAILKGEPDKLAGGIGFGPRLLISEAALRATGLIQPGSLVRWHYRLRLPARGSPMIARRMQSSRHPRSSCPTPAGKCARAPMPRPRSAATSSASRSISRWSA